MIVAGAPDPWSRPVEAAIAPVEQPRRQHQHADECAAQLRWRLISTTSTVPAASGQRRPAAEGRDSSSATRCCRMNFTASRCVVTATSSTGLKGASTARLRLFCRLRSRTCARTAARAGASRADLGCPGRSLRVAAVPADLHRQAGLHWHGRSGSRPSCARSSSRPAATASISSRPLRRRAATVMRELRYERSQKTIGAVTPRPAAMRVCAPSPT